MWDWLLKVLDLRQPTKKDYEHAGMELDYWMRSDGSVPYTALLQQKKRFRVKRKKKREGDVETLGVGKIQF